MPVSSFMRAFILFVFVFVSVKAFGCTCDHSKKHLKNLKKKAEFVFVGQVVSFESIDGSGTKSNVKIRVTKKIKGDVTKEVIVITEYAGSCSTDFVVGREYIIIGKSTHLMFGDDEFDINEIDDKGIVADYNWIRKLKALYTVTFSEQCAITLK